ncbi:MAG: ABC transporter ATP-binding protein [Thermodesulfobacteriota bacterium]
MLEAREVDVFYGEVQALWGISVRVAPETIVSLVGANGAGKTTLLRTISGIIHPFRGEIRFSGRPLVKLRPEKVVELGISHVPEGRRLFSDLTVLENLELGAFSRRARPLFQESLRRVYELFPVLRTRNRQIAGSLSGGEQQMLAIGRGLMTQPRLIMLDEPSLGLSPLVVRTMFELIKTLRDQKVTILLVEQNIYQALRVSDYAFVLKTGKVTLQGRGKELLANSQVQKAYMGKLE